MVKKILIVGAKGMLGQELTRIFSEDSQYTVTAWDREDIDVTNAIEATQKINDFHPDIIFNAVAYNAVDACENSEDEYAKALLLNEEAPRILARIALQNDATIVHYSTDYVFGSAKSDGVGFKEDDQPNPGCKYAQSKLLGEKAVQEVGGKFYIIRLSKLFGKPATSEIAKKSFFETMLHVGKEKSEVNAVNEEVSCFTYAPDLAQASKELVEDEGNGEFGIYHFINEGPATWYDGVVELYKQANLSTKVIPVSSELFPRPAKRPEFSVILNTKRPKLRSYQEALTEFLKKDL